MLYIYHELIYVLFLWRILINTNTNIYIYRLLGKDPDARRDWGQEKKGMMEDEMVGWHHWLDGHGFEWTLGAGDGQGGLACCNSWGHKELDMTERLNWTELKCIHAHTYTHIYTYIMEVYLSSVIHLSTYLPMCLSYILEAFRQVSIVNLISNFGQSFIPIYV